MRLARDGVSLSWPDGPALRSVVARVLYRVAGKARDLRLTRPDRAVSADGLRATWRRESAEEGIDAWIEVAGEGPGDVLLDALDVLAVEAGDGGVCDLGAPIARWTFYQNGWQSRTPTFARRPGESLYTEPGTPAYRRMHQPHHDPARGDDPSSEWVTVLGPPRPVSQGASWPRSLMLGYVTTARQLSELRLDLEGAGFGALVARCHLDGIVLRPGETIRSERLWVRAGPDPLALLEAWAARTGRVMRARVSPSPPAGWCASHASLGRSTARGVLGNLEAVDRYELGLDVVLIDDGYQAAIGDWLSPETVRFPRGVAVVAEAIRAAGHTPGVWIAPFGAAAGSALLAEHPDWVLRDERGEPVPGWVHDGKVSCCALDCTRPAVQGWLRETFRRMRSEWGVTFFRVDRLFAAALPGRRHDPTATRAQALRRGLEAIREGIGDDAFLLACGAPLGPCVGLVDGMRVGPDVDPNWEPMWSHDLSSPAAENALRNGVTRAAFHGRLWANDPGCLLVRQRGAELELVLNEMRTLSALVALQGGVTFDSDELLRIRPGRLKYLRQALPPAGVSARPLDLFEREMPRLFVLEVERPWGRWWVAGVVNWSDRTTGTALRLVDLGLPPGRYRVYHYWRRRYLGVIDDRIIISRHQPHETAVLLFKPVSEWPDLLTTTFHVGQGAIEVASVEWQVTVRGKGNGATGVLRVLLEKAGRQFGEVLLAMPGGWQAAGARVDGGKRPLARVAPGVVRLGLTLAGRAVVEVQFSR
jgi:alpha-galactosidase